MKKNILIICTVLTILNLTACGQNSSETPTNETETAFAKTVAFENTFLNAIDKQLNPDLVYVVESRFMTTISKEKLQNAKSVMDIFPKRETDRMESYADVRIAILKDGEEIMEIGKNEILTNAQIELLQSADYSTNFYIKSNSKLRTQFGRVEDYDLVYYMTIVPETEAKFALGQEALIDYLKTNSKAETIGITQDKLQPGRINFTITKEGKITSVKLDSTSGYPAFDEKLLDLIINMPKTWIPATNSKGEKIDQELIFFFGMQGC
jgi:hypothetical protein